MKAGNSLIFKRVPAKNFLKKICGRLQDRLQKQETAYMNFKAPTG